VQEEQGIMATATVEKEKVISTPPLRTHRFTVEEYERLTEIGFLTPKDRVELLEGWIVDKMPQDPPHACAIDLVQDALRLLLSPDWRLRDQKPIRAGESRPEPDIAVVKGPTARYARHHPDPTDIALVIEVADTTLDEDRGRKGRIYARARIQVYWIVNLEEGKVEVYTDPKVGKLPAYRDRQDFGKKDSLPLVIAGKELGRIAIKDILP
jgi:Uma2 family endonuclease